MRRKPNLDARLQRCADFLVAEPKSKRGLWLIDSVFQELHIELGCGKGRFTVEAAKAEPGVLFVALEKTANVLVIALERAAAGELKNARFLCAFADDITDYFAPGEASRLYINFCDPWPTNRYMKRRLTGWPFLDMYKQVLRPGGQIHFKTDNLPLFEFSLDQFELSGYELLDVSRDLHKDGPSGIMTDYELKFHASGQPIYRCIAVNLP